MFGGPAPDVLAALIQALSTLRDLKTGATRNDGLDCEGVWDGVGDHEQQFRTDAGVLDGARLSSTSTVADRLWARPAVADLTAPARRRPLGARVTVNAATDGPAVHHSRPGHDRGLREAHGLLRTGRFHRAMSSPNRSPTPRSFSWASKNPTASSTPPTRALTRPRSSGWPASKPSSSSATGPPPQTLTQIFRRGAVRLTRQAHRTPGPGVRPAMKVSSATVSGGSGIPSGAER